MKTRHACVLLFCLLAAASFAQQTVPEIPFDSNPDFLKLPENLHLGEVAGVAVNSRGNVFVYSRGSTTGPAFAAAAAQVLEFDSNGRFVREIGKGLYAWAYAHTIRVDRDDNLWAVDKGSDMVIRFNPQGRVSMIFGRKKEASDKEAEAWERRAAVPMPIHDAPVVELVGVHKRFGDKEVLRGVDLAIYPRRITVLIGASGSGKSVIMKHVMGLFKPDRGKIVAFGKDIVPMTPLQLDEVRTHFGLVFQHAALLDWLSVEDNIAFPLVERRRASRQEIRGRVDEILERLKLTDLRRRMPAEISAGQRKRVGVARAIVMKPDVIIYDEPTTGQDPLRTRDIDDMIQETQEQFEITSIVISHDMASTFRIAHMIAMLYHGRIAAYGTPDEVLASPHEHVQAFIHAGSVEA